jgi:hypothetical protein
MEGDQLSLSRSSIILGLIVWGVGASLALNYLRLNWTLDESGLSVMTGRVPFWDFTNLWGGGRLALQGHVEYLFFTDAYRAALRDAVSPLLLDQEWSYPPSMLLIGVPLAAFPILPAYIFWNMATFYFLFIIAGWLGFSLPLKMLATLAPSVILNVILGQNGALTTSLLLGGLLLAPTRPVTAGILLGLLTIKPHIGVLVPFCLLASGNWRAILSASVTTIALVVTTAGFFGWEAWHLFFSQTVPLMRSIMEAPYPQGYHSNAMTFFVMARALGANVIFAYLVQATATVGSIATAVWLWKGHVASSHEIRVVITGMLALCATPYGYTYDAIPLSLAILAILSKDLVSPLLLATGWIYPVINHIITKNYLPLGVLMPASISAAMLFALWRQKPKTTPVRQDGQSFRSETFSMK